MHNQVKKGILASILCHCVHTLPEFSCLKSTMETLEQRVKSVQS